MRLVAASIDIKARPEKIWQAFMRQNDLRAWWGVARSLIEPKPGGLYSLAWEISEQGMKYVSTGIIAELIPSEYLMVRNFVYFNADKEILGPMELEIDLMPIDDKTTKVGIVQSGYQFGGDWDWYYEAVIEAWPKTLELLNDYLDSSH